MKFSSISLATLMGLSLFAAKSVQANQIEQDTNKYTISHMRVQEVPEMRTMGRTTIDINSAPIGSLGCETASVNSALSPTTETGASDVLNPLKNLELIVDQIINIGKKIFAIVEAGRPVVNLKMDVATALPTGARCWMDLQQWQVPQSKVFEVSFINNWGSEVVRMNYRVLWLPGGTVDGVGSYIGYATMAPSDVSVSWGFSLDAEVAIPTVFNMGTKAEPIAGMQMNMHYKIRTPIQHTEQSQAYFVNGQGLFQKLQ